MMPRRSMISHLLAAAAAPALASIIRPAHGAVTSHHLTDLIAEYQTAADALADISLDADPDAWEAVGEVEMRALQALLDHRSSNVVEFAAKFQVLIPSTEDDSEFYVLRALLEDARNLAEDGK